MDVTISTAEVRKVLNPHNLALLPVEGRHKVGVCHPRDMVIEKRFDVLAKYIYAKQREIGGANNWALELYRDHLRCFGNFKEGDGSGKDTFHDYISSFNGLLKSVKTDGFDKNKGYVPIDRNGVIIDGSHRVAACLLYSKPIYTVQFNIDANIYDYNYHLLRGLSRKHADIMALEYIKRFDNVYVAVIFPIVKMLDNRPYDILKQHSTIIYEKDVFFSKIGRRNLIRLLYRGESWLGKEGELSSGLLHHSENRFNGSDPVKFVFLRCDLPETLAEAKREFRSIYNLGNDPIHINDLTENTLEIAEIVLNDNSIHYMNSVSSYLVESDIRNKIRNYKYRINQRGGGKDLYCIDGSGVLALYGLRSARDLDYLHFAEKLVGGEETCDISSHNDQLCYHARKLEDMIFVPDNHFYYDGVKCLTIKNVLAFKKRRKEKKDIDDIKIIEARGNNMEGYAWHKGWLEKMNFKINRNNLSTYLFFKFKRLIPMTLYPFLRKIYRAPLYIKKYYQLRHSGIEYKGYRLCHIWDRSLVQQLLGCDTYEAELTHNIINDLKTINRPVFVDFGANIGLHSLNVCCALPNAKIYAFEPKKKRFDALIKTIEINAISAVKCVPIETLDEWWKSEGRVNVNVLKIDIKGTVLPVLKGACELIKNSNPHIYIKVSRKNTKSRLVNTADLFQYLDEAGYAVRTIEGLVVTERTFENLLNYSSVIKASKE